MIILNLVEDLIFLDSHNLNTITNKTPREDFTGGFATLMHNF